MLKLDWESNRSRSCSHCPEGDCDRRGAHSKIEDLSAIAADEEELTELCDMSEV